MREKYVDSFLNASIEILQQMGAIGATKKEIYEKKGLRTIRDFSVNVGVTGDLHGNVLLNFGGEEVKSIASRMMCGFPVTEIDDMVVSAASELSNMIAGRAGMLLSELDTKIDITPPMACMNTEGKINNNMETMCGILELDTGHTIEIDVSLK